MVGSYVVVLHAKQTCAGDDATSLLPSSSLLAGLPPSIWEKINEWRRRRQHSLDAVLHATDNDQREGRSAGPALAWASMLAGWRAGITRKGIVAKPPSLLPSLLRLSVCPLCYGTLSGPSGERRRAEQNALRKLFCAALTTMSVVKQEEQEEERAS